jgi:UDP-N-acetylglucosamine acyltransferase
MENYSLEKEDLTLYMEQTPEILESKYPDNYFDSTNIIHPTSIIESGVQLGSNNYIGPYCLIKAGTKIGNNNRFEAYCSIGTPPEHKEYFTNCAFPVIIGDNNVFREYVTINAGTVKNTVIGSFVTMLRGSHIGHDSIIWDKVTLSCNVLIGGHSNIMEGANMGLGSICHQYTIIGPYSMIGMGGIIIKTSKILPGKVYVGIPVKEIKDNTVGLNRSNLSEEEYNKLVKLYEDISRMS